MSERVLILGAGGHGQVVADVLLQMHAVGKNIIPIGFVDDDSKTHGKSFLGLPVIGSFADINSIEHDKVIVGIGNNHIRKEKFDLLKNAGECFAIAIHPSAIIAQDVKLGSGSMIMAGVVINTGTTIAENVILNTSCTVDHHTCVEKHVHIAPGVHMGGEIIVHQGALVGIGAIVIPQSTIGAWSIVGAGALVHSHVPDHLTVVGIPAKPLKST